ncbi:MAG: NAD(P)/FAD-dependent oxidoreductase [Oscillospiraceae bacterium]|nr:NAD(P)/FAD-dependent oxidoreductase [Oscillospiraceae bacterium]
MEQYDTIIVGSGPAGLAAAINLKIRRKRFLLFGSQRLSTAVERSVRIDNYLGFATITGPELIKRFKQHIEKAEIEITNEQVTTVYPMGDHFSVSTSKNLYQSAAVILATGASPTSLFPGEERLLGAGVSYCATCDAPISKGKTVAVLGWGDEAVGEANFLAEIAAKVYYLPVKPHKAALKDSIIPLTGSVKEILGDMKIRSLQTSEENIELDSVFVLRESLPPGSLVPGLEAKDGFVQADEKMQTSIPGLFAAGDLTGKPHQLMRAAGQGQTAALTAAAYLDELRK